MNPSYLHSIVSFYHSNTSFNQSIIQLNHQTVLPSYFHTIIPSYRHDTTLELLSPHSHEMKHYESHTIHTMKHTIPAQFLSVLLARRQVFGELRPSPNQIYVNDHSNGQRNGPCGAGKRRHLGDRDR